MVLTFTLYDERTNRVTVDLSCQHTLRLTELIERRAAKPAWIPHERE